MPSVIYQGGAKRLMSDANHLLIVNEIGVTVYDANLLAVDIYTSPNYVPSVRAARYDKKGQLWIADFYQGLAKYDGVNKPYAATYVPNGPYNVSARRLAIKNGKLIVASGSVGDNYTNKFIRNGIYTYDKGVWRNYNYLNYSVMDSFYDFTSVVFDNKLNKEYYGTLWKGLLEFENNEFVKNYSYHNSTLGEALGNDGQYRVSGMAIDSKNQLWVANHWAEKPISVKKVNGTWQNFEFPGVFGELKYVADITIDRNDQKWVVIPASNAILVFKESTNGKVVYKKLTAGQGAGNLPKDATEVFAITEDLDGRIWVGTNAGVVVFYNPSAILQFGADIDAQPVRVVDGEFVQFLLASETVTCIKVDGANRKWMGTKNGAWLFSDDGAQQIHYFNTSNSPLLANKINDIAINGENGIVYFATDNGIVSYRSDATKGYEVNLDQVKVFPNPVRENYAGIIAIQGLVNNAEVKITDINGKLVFRTFANGGQANWDGKNFAAEKVSTGVYLVLATDDFGVETMVKKILVIH
jgi:ligand-binding sensor domain-containing protein